jgi:signal transduction histidine kinase
LGDSRFKDGSEENVREDKVPLARGLSGKLLVLTILFVMLAEILIFIPSVANFRLRWLEDRLNTAAAASIVLLRPEANELSRKVQDDILMATNAKAIAIRDSGVSRLLVVSKMPPQVDEHIDLMAVGPFEAMHDALLALLPGQARTLRVYGPIGSEGRIFEIIISDNGLRSALLTYSRNVALLSLLISLITAGLVFAVISRMLIRPIRSMTRSMLAFGAAPDNPGRIIVPENRSDEIGVAERELAAMQQQLHRTLGEQKRLADLGLAVSKINHDMRNILASAQLMSDRLASAKDPVVKGFAPKLVRTLDRAVSYTEGVLTYGRTQEAAPKRRRLRLREIVEEIFGILVLPGNTDIELVNDVDREFEIDADTEQLFRILTNLCRNALQAMTSDRDASVVRRLTVSAEKRGSVSLIRVIDTGPGLPEKARENLFAAFRGSTRSGGTGLGLAIAQELARSHGGGIELEKSVGGHTEFVVSIPDQPINLEFTRNEKRRQA